MSEWNDALDAAIAAVDTTGARAIASAMYGGGGLTLGDLENAIRALRRPEQTYDVALGSMSRAVYQLTRLMLGSDRPAWDDLDADERKVWCRAVHEFSNAVEDDK